MTGTAVWTDWYVRLPSVALMERLKRRMDFRAAAAALQAPGRSFVLQARQRPDHGAARVGFTVARRVGNAVERNRVRRRLRELVGLAAAESLRAGHDYVLIGRRAALTSPFADLLKELVAALGRVHPPEAQRTGRLPKSRLHEAGSLDCKQPMPGAKQRHNPPIPER